MASNLFIPTGGGPGSDTTAIHRDTANEISQITEKGSPVGADLLLIEDSEDSNNKKKIQLNSAINVDATRIQDTAGTTYIDTDEVADTVKAVGKGGVSISTSDEADAGDIAITAGNSTSGSNAGGVVNITAGNGYGNGAGGVAQVLAGNATGSAAGGAVTIKSGNGAGGFGAGTITIQCGTSPAYASVGAINITGGNGGGQGGAINLTAGNGGGGYKGGDVTIRGGVGNGQDSGAVTIASGNINFGNSGIVTIQTANAPGYISGNINIQTGTGSARGTVTLGAAADGVRLSTQPTGGVDAAIATTKYVDDAIAGFDGTRINDSADTTYVDTNATADTIDAVGKAAVNIKTANAATAGPITIQAGDSTGGGAGGAIEMQAGNSTSSPGRIRLIAGKATGSVNGGTIDIRGGANNGSGTKGGTLYLRGGDTDAGNGDSGDVIIETLSGPSGNTIGDITIQTGYGSKSGDINIIAGATGTAGIITLNAVANNARLTNQPTKTQENAIATVKYVNDRTPAPIVRYIDGTISTGENQKWLRAPFAFDISKVRIGAATAPTGTALIVDINYHATDPDSATTIFTTQANRPSITAGTHTGESGTPDITDVADGGWIGISVDQVGSTVAGADLVVEIFDFGEGNPPEE